MKTLMFLSGLLLLSGCAASNWALRKANDHSYVAHSYPKEVHKVSRFEDWLVLDLERVGEPSNVAEKYRGRQTRCLDRKKDLDGASYTWVDLGPSRACLQGQDLSRLPDLEAKQDLRELFLLPDLEVALRFYPGSGYSLCNDCKNLKMNKARVTEAYYFDTTLFYLKLSDGRWLRFSDKPRTQFREFEPSFADENQFLAEKRKAKEMPFQSISTGHYLHLSLPESEHIYFSQSPIFENGFSVNRLIFRRMPEERVVEKGSKFYYLLMPFTVAVDIVTFPVQWFMLTRAASGAKSSSK